MIILSLRIKGFSRAPSKKLCSCQPALWSCGLILQSYNCSLTCDVIFLSRQAKQNTSSALLAIFFVYINVAEQIKTNRN